MPQAMVSGLFAVMFGLSEYVSALFESSVNIA